MDRSDFEKTCLYSYLKEHYQDTGGLMPLMDLVEDITFEKLLDWFLNEFNNSVAAYNWEDADNCLVNWETVRAFLVKAEWKVDDNYNWNIFRQIVIDIETRRYEIQVYLQFKSLQQTHKKR